MMYVRGRWLGSLLGSLMLPTLASAHGVPPAVAQILMRAPNDVVLATSRGLVFGDPASRRWSLLCGAAFGAPDETPYRVVALPSRALLVATLEGLSRTDDDGCTWQPHATLGEADVTYLLQDPARPARVYVSVFRGAHAGIQASDDGGLTFRRLYEAQPEEFIGSLQVGAGTPGKLFAIIATTEEVPHFFLLRSRDDGATWTRKALALGPDVLDVSLLATHSVAPGELLLRVFPFDQRRGDDVLRSTDDGQTFTPAARFLGLADAAFTPDGQTVYLATSEGLMRAQTSDYAFTRASEAVAVSHVTMHDRKVLMGRAFPAIGQVLPGIEAFTSDANAPPTRYMTFDQVTTPRACPPPSTVATACAFAWEDWSIEFPPQALPVARTTNHPADHFMRTSYEDR
jgi:hypothetical protein